MYINIKTTIPLFRFWVGSILFLMMYSCRHPAKNYTHHITVDTFYAGYDVENVFEYSWVNGINFIQIADTPYLCMFKAADTVIIANLCAKSRTVEIPVSSDVSAYWIQGNRICYITEEDYARVRFLAIDTAKFYAATAGEYAIPPIFNDSFFISAIYLSRVEPLVDNDLFIPYRIRNESPNLVDTFAYIWLKQKPDASSGFSKEVPTPVAYLDHYEYLRFPVCAFDAKSHTLYYAFHKGDTLFAFFPESGQTSKVHIEGLDLAEFTGKQRDLTYLRKYLKQTDKIDRIMVDEQSRIYLFVAKKEGADIKSEIIVFDSGLKEIARLGIKAKLDATIAFIKNNRIYVYETSAHSRFWVFNLVADQLQQQN